MFSPVFRMLFPKISTGQKNSTDWSARSARFCNSGQESTTTRTTTTGTSRSTTSTRRSTESYSRSRLSLGTKPQIAADQKSLRHWSPLEKKIHCSLNKINREFANLLISFLAALVFHHAMSNMKVGDIKPSGPKEVRKRPKKNTQ